MQWRWQNNEVLDSPFPFWYFYGVCFYPGQDIGIPCLKKKECMPMGAMQEYAEKYGPEHAPGGWVRARQCVWVCESLGRRARCHRAWYAVCCARAPTALASEGF